MEANVPIRRLLRLSFLLSHTPPGMELTELEYELAHMLRELGFIDFDHGEEGTSPRTFKLSGDY